MKPTLFITLFALSLMAGCSTSAPTSNSPAASTDSEATVDQVNEQIAENVAEPTYDVALTVPTMNCPFACWPKVKETLEQQPGVAAVTLAAQKEENAIDNPTVYLKLSGEFSADDSIAALGNAGFDGARVGD